MYIYIYNPEKRAHNTKSLIRAMHFKCSEWIKSFPVHIYIYIYIYIYITQEKGHIIPRVLLEQCTLNALSE